jgi:serine/threonine protein phosphatase PrpC
MDLSPRPTPPPAAVCPLAPDINLSLTPEQASALTHPEAAVTLEADGRRWRVHWIERAAWEADWCDRFQERLGHACPALPPCTAVEVPTGVWVAAELRGERPEPWLVPPGIDPVEPLRRLTEFLGPLAQALEQLHARGLVWLNFDPRALEWVAAPDGGHFVRLTNLDLQVFRPSEVSPHLRPCPAFAAPEVGCRDADEFGPRTDVFHLALFSYCWLAGLLPDGLPGLGPEAFAYDFPPLRVYTPGLPPGVASKLARGLHFNPAQRPATVTEFVETLHEVRQRAERRWAATAPVTWEVGLHTRAGHAKEALGRSNQDQVLVQRFTDPDRSLVAVTDGISVCDVGDGALASWLTCLVLENCFGPDSTAEGFPDRITEACHRGAQALLSWALESGYRRHLEQGRHLMGTTLTAGWLEGNRLRLANLGDSRAYLVEAENVEQLTVDGDLACGLLDLRAPPEEVRTLGRMAGALRECVGGFSRSATGELHVQDHCCTPHLSDWPLLPGDVLILCSDGLVDEGTALGPSDLAQIVGRGADLSAEELAFQLAEAADARQRLPTPLEPDGWGDNISCIVVKVR